MLPFITQTTHEAKNTFILLIMKKNIVIPTLLLAVMLISPLINAQPYQPFPTDDAKWEVTRCFYFYQPGWYDKYTFTMDGSDTIYDGVSFKKIYVITHHLPGTIHDSIYPTQFFGGLRESGKQVFIWQKWASTDTTVQLVYDFNNTSIGDTIYTKALAGNPKALGHLVTGKDSVLIGSNYHARIHLQDPDNNMNTEDWIEGVGSSWGLPFASFWSITDNSYDISCFYKNHKLQYGNPSPTYGFCLAPLPIITCEPTPTIISETRLGNILFSIYPNPATDQVNLNRMDLKAVELILTIYTVTGIKVRSETLKAHESEINIKGLGNGIYWVVIQSKDRIESKQLIIQR